MIGKKAGSADENPSHWATEDVDQVFETGHDGEDDDSDRSSNLVRIIDGHDVDQSRVRTGQGTGDKQINPTKVKLTS